MMTVTTTSTTTTTTVVLLLYFVILLWTLCTIVTLECVLFYCLFLGNADALNLVDTALFCLAFEDSDNSDPIHLSRLFLYGDAASRSLITPALIDRWDEYICICIIRIFLHKKQFGPYNLLLLFRLQGYCLLSSLYTVECTDLCLA